MRVYIFHQYKHQVVSHQNRESSAVEQPTKNQKKPNPKTPSKTSSTLLTSRIPQGLHHSSMQFLCHSFIQFVAAPLYSFSTTPLRGFSTTPSPPKP